MGVPVGVKDLLAVDGAPTHAGSVVDVADRIGGEGSFVRLLKSAGCVILGKTRTVEFALGALGTNPVRGTPVMPWDATTPRAPGGSSSGSGAAMGAGLCAFAIGTDTGGSVRGPAAFCGTFGLKTTVGRWQTDGIFPLSPTLDSIGPLTRTAADAAVVFAALTDGAVPLPARLKGLRLGKPTSLFYDGMDADVTRTMTAALAALEDAGVAIVDVEVPEVEEANRLFGTIVASELIAVLGHERFLANRHRMDPGVAERTAIGLDVPAAEWIQARWRHDAMRRIAGERMAGFDGWITPTRQMVAPLLGGGLDADAQRRLAAEVPRNTRVINLFGQCATATPIHGLGSPLPTSLQVVCPAGADARALSIALAIETLIGEPPAPDLSGFLIQSRHDRDRL
jgi:aspartyl-tRNA(Asn)/glutamyl-tRNA(Gln) amidotransferase subunit A